MRLINAPTATSRDSSAPKLSSHVAAEDGSVFAQRFIRFAKSWSRISPCGKEAAHALAACGSVPAHCEMSELVASTANHQKDAISCPQWQTDCPPQQPKPCLAESHPARPRLTNLASKQAPRRDWSVPIGTRSQQSDSPRVSPLLFCTANSAAAFGSVSLHSVSTGSREFWRYPSSGSSSIQASAVCGSDLASCRAIAPAIWSLVLPGARAAMYAVRAAGSFCAQGMDALSRRVVTFYERFCPTERLLAGLSAPSFRDISNSLIADGARGQSDSHTRRSPRIRTRPARENLLQSVITPWGRSNVLAQA